MIPVACPICHTFFDATEGALTVCRSCGKSLVALRVVSLADMPSSNHPCLRYSGIKLATSGGKSLYALSAPKHHGDGSCGMSCDWGAPFLLTDDVEEAEPFSRKILRTNIYPVIAPPKVMQHGTQWASLPGLLRYGLLPKTDPRMRKYRHRGHGYPGTEKWLRFTGQENAARTHLRGPSWLIIPIAYEGLVLHTCMGHAPWNLQALFAAIPSSIGCIRMAEDGEAYVFRKEVPLPIALRHLPFFLYAGLSRTIRGLMSKKVNQN